MRHYQKAIAPVEFPPALRAQLARPNWSLADRFAREEIFDAYRPKVARALAEDHVAMGGETRASYYVPDNCAAGRRVTDTWRGAQAHTLRQHRELQTAHLSRAFDEQEIRDYAENYARICGKMVSLDHAEDFARGCGVIPPAGRTITRAGALARLQCPQWWRRKLRVAWTRRAENVLREIGIVRKGREPYASDDAVMARQGQRAKGKEFLENHVAVNEAGEQLEMLKLHEGSTANPAIRRGEFMTRVRGFEEIAADSGHVAQFWTLTTPSAYHAHLSTGHKNPNFARETVRTAQAWLCKMWARARAKLKRLSILVYGFRIAEPHHDATPHWHLLLFMRPRDASTVERVVRDYWLSEYESEKGAREHRAKCIEIDASKGSAAGYVAKYVSKNIDGAGAIGESTDEETGRTVFDGVRRVDAWASLHGIRQFQQVGGPPVGLWRECRRITEAVRDDRLESIRRCADRGSWAGFIRALSFDGIAAGRRTALKLLREETGELTKYAEEKAAPVIGLRFCSAVEITRPHTWRIQRCGTLATIDGGNSSRPAVTSDYAAPAAVGWSTASVRGGGLCGLGLGHHQRPKEKSRRRHSGSASAVYVGTAGESGSGSFPSIFSDLGPVAITVRGEDSPPGEKIWPNKPRPPS